MPQASHESVAAYSAMLTTIRLDSFDVYRRHGCDSNATFVLCAAGTPIRRVRSIW